MQRRRRALRPRRAASDPARTQGRRRHPPPGRRRRWRACGSAPRTGRLPPPALAGCSLRPLAAPRRFSSGLPYQPLHSCPPSATSSTQDRPHRPIPRPRRLYARTRLPVRALPRTRLPVGEPASAIRYRNNTQRRRLEMFNKNGSNNGNGAHQDTAHSYPERQRAQARRRTRHRPRPRIERGAGSVLGRAAARRLAGARPVPRHGPRWSPSGRGAAAGSYDYLEGHAVHRPGQPHLRLRRLGLRAGRRRHPAPDRDGRSPRPAKSRSRPGLQRPGEGHRRRRSAPAPTPASTRWPRRPSTATTLPSREPSRTA